jgi:hypothetical protein
MPLKREDWTRVAQSNGKSGFKGMNKQAESKTTFQDKIPSSESAELGASIEKGYKVQLIYIL